MLPDPKTSSTEWIESWNSNDLDRTLQLVLQQGLRRGFCKAEDCPKEEL